MPDQRRGIVVPPGYTSPDVIDRRDGQGPTLMEHIRQLLLNVQNDYNETKPGQTPLVVGKDDAYSQGMHDEAAKRIHMRIRGLFREGS